jgi:predicted glutamine amidotransferase
MCIILYKPKNVKIPSKTVMENCFTSNPHGAGYMYRYKNVVHIRKGFMTFNAFYDDLIEHIVSKYDVVMHFRIATHAKVSPENCHPFPITSVRSELHELVIDCNRAMVHNGILHNFVDKDDDISDSAFFAKMLYPCRRESQYKAILDCHNKTNKFVVMTSRYTVVSGHFVKKYGCYFSNYGYEDQTATTYFSTGCSATTQVIDLSDVANHKVNIIDDEYDAKYPNQYSKQVYDNEYWMKVYNERKKKLTDDLKDFGNTIKNVGKRQKQAQLISTAQQKQKNDFKEYLDKGEEVLTTKQKFNVVNNIPSKKYLPILTLSDGMGTTIYVGDNMSKEKFISYIDKGFEPFSDGRKIGLIDQTITVDNAKNIVGENYPYLSLPMKGYMLRIHKNPYGNVVVESVVFRGKIKEEKTVDISKISDVRELSDKEIEVISNVANVDKKEVLRRQYELLEELKSMREYVDNDGCGC